MAITIQPQSCNSRPLTQAELDGYHRFVFIERVLKALDEGRHVKFLYIRHKYSIVDIEKRITGEWNFSVGDKHWYTYRLSALVDMLESLYDLGGTVQKLNGEIDIPNPQHPISNAAPEDEPESSSTKSLSEFYSS